MILVDVLIARNGITEELGERLYFLKYPIPEIPEDSEKISGMDWVLEKISGIGYPLGTAQESWGPPKAPGSQPMPLGANQPMLLGANQVPCEPTKAHGSQPRPLGAN